MTTNTFLLLIDFVLNQIENQIDEWINLYDLDIDISRTNNAMHIICAKNIQMILNTQPSIEELWVASYQFGGLHYRYNGIFWENTRDHSKLEDILSSFLSNFSKKNLQFFL